MKARNVLSRETAHLLLNMGHMRASPVCAWRGMELARGSFVFVGDCKEQMATEDVADLWENRGESLMVLGYRPSWEARGWRRFFGRFLFHPGELPDQGGPGSDCRPRRRMLVRPDAGG